MRPPGRQPWLAEERQARAAYHRNPAGRKNAPQTRLLLIEETSVL